MVAIAPAGGWALGDPAIEETLRYFKVMQRLVREAVPRAELIASTPEGRARSTAAFASTAEHISPDLVAWFIHGAAACEVTRLVDHAAVHGWGIDAEAVTCPVRIVWGSEDRLLPLPGAAMRFRQEWFPQAEWIEIEGAGHCPQLDHPLETAELIAGFSD